jgi:hypothetical protein
VVNMIQITVPLDLYLGYRRALQAVDSIIQPEQAMIEVLRKQLEQIDA